MWTPPSTARVGAPLRATAPAFSLWCQGIAASRGTAACAGVDARHCEVRPPRFAPAWTGAFRIKDLPTELRLMILERVSEADLRSTGLADRQMFGEATPMWLRRRIPQLKNWAQFDIAKAWTASIDDESQKTFLGMLACRALHLPPHEVEADTGSTVHRLVQVGFMLEVAGRALPREPVHERFDMLRSNFPVAAAIAHRVHGSLWMPDPLRLVLFRDLLADDEHGLLNACVPEFRAELLVVIGRQLLRMGDDAQSVLVAPFGRAVESIANHRAVDRPQALRVKELSDQLVQLADALRLQVRAWEVDSPQAVVEAIGLMPPAGVDASLASIALGDLDHAIQASVLATAGRRLTQMTVQLETDAHGLRDAVTRFMGAASSPSVLAHATPSLLNSRVYLDILFGPPGP